MADRFDRLLQISVALGVFTSTTGAYLSYFLDGSTGAVIVLLQTALFLVAFFFGPKHGVFANRRRAAERIATGTVERQA